jgi:hypothetical protein
MRAVAVGLIGVVLALGGAQAAECRAGHMKLENGEAVMSVSAVSYTETVFEGHKGQRTLFKGAIKGQPYIIDLQGVQGSSSFLTSYEGNKPDAGGMAVKWGRDASRWQDGSRVPVEDGPLKGMWRAVCR